MSEYKRLTDEIEKSLPNGFTTEGGVLFVAMVEKPLTLIGG